MASSGSLFREYLDYPYGKSNTQRLYARAKASLDVVQRLRLETKLEMHSGCVNTICWNEAGTLVLSGSDDQHLCITDPFTSKRIISIQSGHLANIFSAKFLPNTQDNQVVSCSGDGMIQYTIVDRPDQHGQHPFDCHFGTTYELVTVPQDSNTFLSCGEDGTVRWFDLRIKDTCVKDECKEDILINCRRAVTALAINPLLPYQLSVGCSDSTVRIFDRRMLGTRATGNYLGCSALTGMVSRFTAPLLEGHSHRVTSLSYSTDGSEVLASYSSEQLYLFNLNEDGRKEVETDGTKTSQQKDGASGDVASSTSPRHPPIKRLRLRGDWSDTGPNARPERERSPNQTVQAADAGGSSDGNVSEPAQAEAASAPPSIPPPPPPVAGQAGESRSVTIMQRMSDMLTQWLEGVSRQADQRQETPRDNSVGSDADADNLPPALEEPSRDDVLEGQGEAHAELEAQALDVELVTSATTGDGSPEIPETISHKDEAEIRKSTKAGDDDKLVENSNDLTLLDNGVENTEDTLSQCHSITTTTTTTQNKSVIECESESPKGSLPETSKADGGQPLGVAAAHSDDLESSGILCYSPDSTSAASITDFPESGTAGGPNLPLEVCACNTPEGRASPPNVITSASTSPVEVMSSASKSPMEVTARASESSVEVETDTSESCVEVTASASTSPVEVRSSASRSTSVDRSEPRAVKPLNVLGACEYLKAVAVDDEDTSSVNLASSQAEISSNPPDVDIAGGGISVGDYKDYTQVENKASAANTGDSDACSLSVSEKPDASHTIKYSPSDDESPIAQDGASSATGAPDGNSEVSKLPGSNDDMPRRLASANRGRRSSGGEVVPPVRGRQRRHGHSGPPSGDFQLHTASEDDSDEELTHSASRRDQDDMERNLAALRLQEMYRKRLEEREWEEQQLLDIHQPRLKQVYRGHRNARTMIKEAAFWGDEFVMSGSDCGHIFVWDRHTAELVMLLEGDKHVVNCLQPHPMDPVLASSGIDYDIKVWMPTEQTPNFDTQNAEEVVSRNRVMLEETRDTITVPASFMLRMLASLNHIRSGRRQGGGNSSSSSDDE